jgi:hypothetical protein
LKILSNWRSVRLWETQVERDLSFRGGTRPAGGGHGAGDLEPTDTSARA